MSIKFTVLSWDPVARYLSENATLLITSKNLLMNKRVVKKYQNKIKISIKYNMLIRYLYLTYYQSYPNLVWINLRIYKEIQ